MNPILRRPLALSLALVLAPLAGAQVPLPKPAGGTHAGPGDTVPAGRSGGSGGDSGPATPGPAKPSGGGGTAEVGPRPSGPAYPRGAPAGPFAGPLDVTVHEVGPEEWWTWWQLHKVEFLRPNLMRRWIETVSGIGGGDEHPGAPLQRLRDELAPQLAAELTAGDPQLRAAAALAYGRVARAASVDALLPLFADASQAVRERALFALGATGTERAAELLLRVARTGALEHGGASIAPDAPALAVFALAVGRRNGMDESLDARVAALADLATRPGESLLATSLFFYQTLSPTDALHELALELARDEETSPLVRCRALETLRLVADERSLATLSAALDARQADVRRSAALALGELAHPQAVPRLIAAAEEENEPLARGFLLISIGRQGSAQAERYLVGYLREGPKTARPWAGLALALAARAGEAEGRGDAARSGLRKALREARSADLRSALLLALGVARDERSRGALEDALFEDSSPECRAAAGFGLAMLGDLASAGLLEARLAAESDPIVRAELAQALGYLGAPSSLPGLVTALRETRDPWLRMAAAYALGLHGTRGGIEALLAFADEEHVEPAVRAASFEALQLVLGQSPSLTIGELLRQANFAVFPPTLIRLRTIPL